MCRPDVAQPPKKGGTTSAQPDQPTVQRGIYWAAGSIALWLVAMHMNMPYHQDLRNALNCDSLCQGSLNSAKSTLVLLGAAVMGKLSDDAWLDPYGGGRRICLLVGQFESSMGNAVLR